MILATQERYRTLEMAVRVFVVGAALSVCLALPVEADAQIDLSGRSATRQHDDALERGGGPAIGEYQGLPINDANRARGEAWSATVRIQRRKL
jgi:hypothetical protein